MTWYRPHICSINELVDRFGDAKATWQSRASKSKLVPVPLRSVLECAGGRGTGAKKYCSIWSGIKVRQLGFINVEPCKDCPYKDRVINLLKQSEMAVTNSIS